jgi:hypothetical protein
MKRLVNGLGLGVGLALGSGVVYAFFISEAMRLVTVGVGAFVLAALTIGGTALLVNRQWTKALASQSHRTIHHHRYPTYGAPPMLGVEGNSAPSTMDLLPPALPAADHNETLDDEVVA